LCAAVRGTWLAGAGAGAKGLSNPTGGNVGFAGTPRCDERESGGGRADCARLGGPRDLLLGQEAAACRASCEPAPECRPTATSRFRCVRPCRFSMKRRMIRIATTQAMAVWAKETLGRIERRRVRCGALRRRSSPAMLVAAPHASVGGALRRRSSPAMLVAARVAAAAAPGRTLVLGELQGGESGALYGRRPRSPEVAGRAR